jgi:hypothetical protein
MQVLNRSAILRIFMAIIKTSILVGTFGWSRIDLFLRQKYISQPKVIS